MIMMYYLSEVMSLGIHEWRKSIKIIFAQQRFPTFYCCICELPKQKSFNYVYVRLSLLLFSASATFFPHFCFFFSFFHGSVLFISYVFLFIIVNSLTRHLSYRSQKHTTTIIRESFLLFSPLTHHSAFMYKYVFLLCHWNACNLGYF